MPKACWRRVKIIDRNSVGEMPSISLEVQEHIDDKLKEKLKAMGILDKVKLEKKNSASVQATAKLMAQKQSSAASKELRAAFGKAPVNSIDEPPRRGSKYAVPVANAQLKPRAKPTT